MYLLFSTYEEADARNRKAIIDRGYPSGITTTLWNEIEVYQGQYQGDWALDVGTNYERDLTPKEISELVPEINEQSNLVL